MNEKARRNFRPQLGCGNGKQAGYDLPFNWLRAESRKNRGAHYCGCHDNRSAKQVFSLA